jgi:REP element-mobilizing transposase RayT
MLGPLPAQNRDRQGAYPAAYLITFVCYGTWLPGQSGAVDRSHNLFGGRTPEPNPATEAEASGRMRQPPFWLDADRRQVVVEAIHQVCLHRGWILLAAHARSSHVHAVVEAAQSPEQVMNAFKAYASRALNRTGPEDSNRRRWARHGSTRYLWTTEAISAAVHYVVCEQGEPMAVLQMPAAGWGSAP